MPVTELNEPAASLPQSEPRTGAQIRETDPKLGRLRGPFQDRGIKVLETMRRLISRRPGAAMEMDAVLVNGPSFQPHAF